jgi:FkbM family methyltransferase
MLPLGLKLLLPGYRARWLKRYAGMIAALRDTVPKLEFGQQGEVPWLEERDTGIRFHGFWTEAANLEVFRLLRPVIPAELDARWFRLVKDYINRYLYPHMRPDLKPEGFAQELLFGFHGQHKDAIADYPHVSVHQTLNEAFRPNEDEVVLDCGAFLGFGSMHMSRQVKHGRVIAVEPDKDCFAILQRNLAHNKIANIQAIEAAIWREEGSLTLERSFAQANTLVSEVAQGQERAEVETVSIDHLCARLGIQRLDMLSLTLNGAEVEALEGAGKTLSELRPRIRLAGWYSRDGRKIWQITKEHLEKQGYNVYVGRHGNVMALPVERSGQAS